MQCIPKEKQMTSRLRQFGLLIATFVLGGLTVGAFNQAWSEAEPDMSNPLFADPLWFYMVKPAKKGTDSLFKEHLNYQIKLERERVLFGAGPVFDPDGKFEFGLVVVRAGDAEEARQIAETDPMQATGTRTYTLHQWRLVEGHMSFGVDFHDGRATLR